MATYHRKGDSSGNDLGGGEQAVELTAIAEAWGVQAGAPASSATDKMVREVFGHVVEAITAAEDERRDAQRASPSIESEDWQPGDVVLDDHGRLWVRADPDDTAQGWPWGYPSTHTRGPGDRAHAPEGSVVEREPVRPLTLLVRNGRPALGA